MPANFYDTQNRAIEAVVPLALQANRLDRAEKAAAAHFAFEKEKWASQLQEAKDKNEIEQMKARLTAGIGMTPEDVTRIGGTPEYKNVSMPGMDASSEDALRSQIRPDIENVSISPTQLVPDRAFPPEDFEGATKFDVSGRVFQPPVPLELRKLAQQNEGRTMEGEKTRANALEVARIRNEGKSSDTSWQSVSVTEKGGLPIWKNPKTRQTIVKAPDGAEETYDPKVHGKELSQNVSQTTIYNQGQGQGAAGTFKPGTLDYMVEKYETDGVIPPFGMGSVGAKQRAAFFDKTAERARQRGDTGGEQAVRGAEFKSSQSTLTDLTKREQLIESYNVRINTTSDKVLIPLIKKYDLQNPRFINWPVNKLAEIMGSGDLASLKLALNSVSVEVGKVEFNALGIQQLTDSAAKFMNSVHDPNMKVGDLLKVIDTSKALGKTGSEAISGQRKGLRNRLQKIAPAAGEDSDPLGIRKAK